MLLILNNMNASMLYNSTCYSKLSYSECFSRSLIFIMSLYDSS